MDNQLTGRDRQLLETQAWLSQVEEKLLRQAVELAEAARDLQRATKQLEEIK